MKTILLSFLIMTAALFTVGCEDDNEILIVDEVPQPPQGVYSVTGDNAIYVYWNGVYEEDIEAYTIWRSNSAASGYVQIGVVNAVVNPNLDLIEYEFIDNTAINGNTYYYAVASLDEAGQESELSAENVPDTPRPEGSVTLYDFDSQPNLSGLILDSTLWITSYLDPEADIYIDSDVNAFYINATDTGVYLQDMGYTDNFDIIGYAPNTLDGWSVNGWAELIYGHTYVIWDRDGFFSKLRVTGFGADFVNFQWAFQLDPNNPELVKPRFDEEKPALNSSYNKLPATSNHQ